MAEYVLLTSSMNSGSGYLQNRLRQNFFRAGHAHAGVIVILSLVCQMFADGAVLPDPLRWLVRIGAPLAALFISSGFFFSVLPRTGTQASGAVAMIYLGAAVLAFSGGHPCGWAVAVSTELGLQQNGVQFGGREVHCAASIWVKYSANAGRYL